MSTLNRSNWDNDQPTDVDRWLEIYSQDDNLFWATDTGHIQNVVDALIYRLETSQADAWEEGWGNGNVYGLSKKPREENYINPYRQGETE